MQGRAKDSKHTKAPKVVQGIIQITRRGSGFLPWSAEASAEATREWHPAAAKGFGKAMEDIEIDNENLGGALNGDEVEVEIEGMRLPKGRKALTSAIRPHGTVVKVINRSREEFVCTLKTNADRLVAVPDEVRFYRPITLRENKDSRFNIHELQPETKIVVRLISFDGKTDPVGEIISKLGVAGEHRTEMNAIVLENGFATSFPPEVGREAQEIEKNHAKTIESEAGHREDFRNVTTFTIDPLTAKDFDDAISVRVLENNEYEIGIHIADVSYFVRPGTALDDEAIKRGTSVYLVDATIPMLPEELSGNVCSLRQDEDRLAFSAIFKINAKAEVLDRRIARTIIRSDRRFTYEEAQEILNKNAGEFIHELTVLRDIARILRREREQKGAIDFGDNEVKFELDQSGKVLSVTRKERIETNLLIEEFMLLANREVATFMVQLSKKVPESKLAFVYRIHDEPKEDRIEELATFVRAVGCEFGKAGKSRSKISARDIQKLLKDIEGTPEEQLIRTATLRSMAKAIYSTRNIGHFGLAFQYYTHFTSPIRRYPDVLVHRILNNHLTGSPIARDEYIGLEKMCIAASEQEAKAANAERESIKYKQVEYMSGKVGQEFEGVISGVVEWGLYVEEKNTAAEGLVRVASMSDDYYNFAPKAYALYGQRKNKKYALGDTVRVKLVSADLINRQLEFVLA